jgi:hypothetical protein
VNFILNIICVSYSDNQRMNANSKNQRSKRVRADPVPPAEVQEAIEDRDMEDPDVPEQEDVVCPDLTDDISAAIRTLCDRVDKLNATVVTFDGSKDAHTSIEKQIEEVKKSLMDTIDAHSRSGQLLVRARDAMTAIIAVAKAKVDAQRMLAEKMINLRK